MKVKKKINKKYLQDLQTVADKIKLSPTAILLRVFDISVQSVATYKARVISHRQLAIANKELSFFFNKTVKLPFRHCPYCTSTRLIITPYMLEGALKCKCLTCNREIKYEELEGGEKK